MEFENIRNIKPDDADTWKEKIFLTFDVDWASDEVLAYLLDMVEKSGVKATFFCTHETKLMKIMRENADIELGIHPNFNFLLNGDFRYGKNISEVVDYYRKICPDAVSARSHCLTENAAIAKVFSERGLRYDCNILVPASANIELKPWEDCNKGLIKVPLLWEDDVHCLYGWEFDLKSFTGRPGLKVFNFHPMFVFLNIEKIQRYHECKECGSDYNKLKSRKNKSYGVENFLKELLAKNG